MTTKPTVGGLRPDRPDDITFRGHYDRQWLDGYVEGLDGKDRPSIFNCHWHPANVKIKAAGWDAGDFVRRMCEATD